jgi:hypothetical protein
VCDCHWADSHEIYACSAAFVQKTSLNFMKNWPVLISGHRHRVKWTDMVSKSGFFIKHSNQTFADKEGCKSNVSLKPFINLCDNLFNDVCPDLFGQVWDKVFAICKTRNKVVMQILCVLRWCIEWKTHRLCSKNLSEGC